VTCINTSKPNSDIQHPIVLSLLTNSICTTLNTTWQSTTAIC